VGASGTELIRIPESLQLWSGITKLMSSSAFVRLHHGALHIAFGLSIFAVVLSILFSWTFGRGSAGRRVV
jgi:hypothetical protein